MAYAGTDDKELVISKEELINILAEKNLALNIIQIFHEEVPIRESLGRVLIELCKHTNTQIAEIWLCCIDGIDLKLVAQVGVHLPVAPGEKKKEMQPNEGLIGEAWRTGQRQEIDFILESHRFVRPHFAKENNLLYGVAIPVIYHQDVMAVIGFYSKHPKGSCPPLYLSPFILEQLAAEIKRKKMEENLQLFFSLTPDLLAIAGSNGYFKKVNPEFTNSLGYSESELLARSIMELVHPDDYAKVQEKVQQLSMGHYVRAFDLRLITKEKKIKWITWTVTSLPEEGLLFGVGRDITEQIKLQQAVAAEQQRFKKMFVEAPVSMCILKGKDHVFQSANEHYYKLTGRDERIIGMNVRDVFPEVEGQGYFEWLDQVYRNGETFSSQETPLLIDTDGSGKLHSKFISFMYQPYRNEQGQVEGIFYFGVDVTEQVHARKEIEKSEERFRVIFEQAAVGVALLNSNTGEILRANKRYCEIFGYTSEELTTLTFMQFSHPADLPADLENMELLRQGRIREFSMEKRFIRKNGSLMWANLTVSPMWKAGEPPDYHIAIVMDISERKKAEDNLKASEQMLNQSQQLTHIGSWEWDIWSDIIYWSDELYRIYGIHDRTKKLSFETFMSLNDDHDIARVQKVVSTAIEQKQNFQYYHSIVRPDGEKRLLFSQGEVLVNDKGIPVKLRGVSADVTEKKKAEEELEKLSLIAQKTINAVIVTNPNREIVWVNKAFTKLTEFTFEEVANKKVDDILHGPETDPSILSYIHRQIEKNRPFRCELIKYTKSGKPIWVEIESQPIFDEKGKLTHYFDIETDITERKKIIQKLIKSKEAVSHFARQLNAMLEDERARIAREIHDEFGQQLTGLKMSLASLNQFETDSVASVTIASMVNTVENTMRSLRNFSTELRPGILDTLGLIPTLEWLTSEFQKKNNIECRFISSAQSFDFGNEASISLFRICQEALTNIAKHAGATAVIVKANTDDNGFYLEIKDNGRGISREKLSDPFSMGLLGMRERARLLNADFKISSKENKGTTIKVKMPIT
jgi:PAS domain S-box-containing protein